MSKRETDLITLYQDERRKIELPISDIVKLADAVWDTYANAARVFVMGNGGGADIANHFASDLAIHPFVSADKHKSQKVPRLEVHSLNESPGTLTRIGNDMGYENVFIEQLKNYSLLGPDLVIAFSVSGNSKNILKALEYTARCGSETCCIGKGGKAQDMVGIPIIIQGASQFPGQTGANDNYFHVEDAQQSIAHIVTGLIKERVNA